MADTVDDAREAHKRLMDTQYLSSRLENQLAQVQQLLRDANLPKTADSSMLILAQPDGRSRPVEFTSEFLSCGSAEDNDILLQSAYASRHHCELRAFHDEWVLRDLDSRNGTFVNGNRCQQIVLKDGDLIEIGDVKLCFVTPLDLSSSAMELVQ